MKDSERFKIKTSESGIGGFYCSILEYATARNKRTGRLFTKFLRFISVGENKPFADRDTALAAGRAHREVLVARSRGRVASAPAQKGNEDREIYPGN
jgi:hypothetical protein